MVRGHCGDLKSFLSNVKPVVLAWAPKLQLNPLRRFTLKLSYTIVYEINRSIGFESIHLPHFYHVFLFFWQDLLVKYFLRSWCFLEFSKLKTVQDNCWSEHSNIFCDSCFVRLGSKFGSGTAVIGLL